MFMVRLLRPGRLSTGRDGSGRRVGVRSGSLPRSHSSWRSVSGECRWAPRESWTAFGAAGAAHFRTCSTGSPYSSRWPCNFRCGIATSSCKGQWPARARRISRRPHEYQSSWHSHSTLGPRRSHRDCRTRETPDQSHTKICSPRWTHPPGNTWASLLGRLASHKRPRAHLHRHNSESRIPHPGHDMMHLPQGQPRFRRRPRRCLRRRGVALRRGLVPEP